MARIAICFAKHIIQSFRMGGGDIRRILCQIAADGTLGHQIL